MGRRAAIWGRLRIWYCHKSAISFFISKIRPSPMLLWLFHFIWFQINYSPYELPQNPHPLLISIFKPEISHPYNAPHISNSKFLKNPDRKLLVKKRETYNVSEIPVYKSKGWIQGHKYHHIIIRPLKIIHDWFYYLKIKDNPHSHKFRYILALKTKLVGSNYV